MGIIEKYKDEILYYQIEGFNLDENVNHLFTTRIGWEQGRIAEGLSKIFNIPQEKVYKAKQVHGTEVLVITNEDNRDINDKEKDGLITKEKGIVLCTSHADCVPIYFYDNIKGVIGVAHAGWKGTLNNIVQVIVQNMTLHFNCNVEDISSAIGPSIGSCCYEIGQDVEKLFMEKYPNNHDIIKEKEGKTYLDLWIVNKINLLNAGIDGKNIFYSDLCTSCRVDTLYSYRKEKGTKNRMVAAITLNQ